MLKKATAILLATVIFMCTFLFTASAQKESLTFNEDGKFRILQINDFQDRDAANAESVKFLNAVLDTYNPDLVVLVGDQLSDYFPDATPERIKAALSVQLTPMEQRGIPFVFTFGNHDIDHAYRNTMSLKQQADFYRSFSCCYANENGADEGTYNTLIYKNDGTTPCLNVYMFNTHHWDGSGLTSGVNKQQVDWYVNTSNRLKQENGGNKVPSLVFQHIPVKEIMMLLKQTDPQTPGALKSKFDDTYLVLDDGAQWIGDRNVMRETPACEHPSISTGQYEAWVNQGDIIGAYFGHDHINTFVGKTKDGITLGYNGGFGFATYGDPGERYARIFDFDQNDVENYTQKTIYYTQTVTQSEPEPAPEPEPEDPSENCSCNCHKGGFMGFIWKIVRFFQRLFGVNKTCKCGIEHY